MARVVVPDLPRLLSFRGVGKSGDDSGFEEECRIILAQIRQAGGPPVEGMFLRQEGKHVSTEHEEAGAARKNDSFGRGVGEPPNVLLDAPQGRRPVA
jgi:hypothetical protein